MKTSGQPRHPRGTKQSRHRRRPDNRPGLYGLCLDCFATLAMTGHGDSSSYARNEAIPACIGDCFGLPASAIASSFLHRMTSPVVICEEERRSNPGAGYNMDCFTAFAGDGAGSVLRFAGSHQPFTHTKCYRAISLWK
ncbi:MAG: hypothetical protein LBJ47_11515 [Tannerella sp.]|nr:hypothetical protein [Tannerella sp.]